MGRYIDTGHKGIFFARLPVDLVPESFSFRSQFDGLAYRFGNDEDMVELMLFEPLQGVGFFLGGLAENIEEGVGVVLQPGDGTGFVHHAVGQDA